MILPLLGGTPGVWNTSMVFFQAVLLCGYSYAHLLSSRLSARRQMAVHFTLLVVALAALPVAVPKGWEPPPQANPALWVVMILGLSVGLPTLAKAPDSSFDLIVIDAFSSDSVPVHIITREAFDLYASKLAPGGILAANISNAFLDLAPVLVRTARDLGWSCIMQVDNTKSAADHRPVDQAGAEEADPPLDGRLRQHPGDAPDAEGLAQASLLVTGAYSRMIASAAR